MSPTAPLKSPCVSTQLTHSVVHEGRGAKSPTVQLAGTPWHDGNHGQRHLGERPRAGGPFGDNFGHQMGTQNVPSSVSESEKLGVRVSALLQRARQAGPPFSWLLLCIRG